jgi:predicted GIY-YIG superfamily endonuclease
MTGAWVYMLLCSDGTYYVGCTTNLDNRIAQHQEGTYPGYTCARRPVKLVWVADFPDIFQAIEVERKLKGWSRKKKEALIRDDFEAIHNLAQSQEMRERRAKRRIASESSTPSRHKTSGLRSD